MNLKLWFIPVCMDLIDDLGLDDPTLCLAFDFEVARTKAHCHLS